MTMELEDILRIDGIVIRKIPEVIQEKYIYYGKKVRGRLVKSPIADTVFDVVERRSNYAGKYFITHARNSSADVDFYITRCGIGDCIPSAYQDYLKKTYPFLLSNERLL